MDPFLEIESILPYQSDLDAHRAILAHPRLASLTTWAPPSRSFMSWLESNEVPEELRKLLSLGLPSRGRDAETEDWTIFSPQTIRMHAEVDSNLLRSRLLPIGQCFFDEPLIVFDLAGPHMGSVCFIDALLYRNNIPPFPRAYMRLVCSSLTAFFIGVAKDALPTGPGLRWSASNCKGTWTYEAESDENPS
jgi:hypothetical protein